MKPHKLSTFQMRHAALTSTFVFAIDKHGMLRTLARLRGSALRGRALAGAVFILALLMNVSFAATTNANQKPSNIMNIKLHAYNKLSWEQFECYNWLIFKESNWNPLAKNGSHYGLGQMRSKWVSTLTPFKQIDVHLRYIKHRYNGDTCKALSHLERKGWH